MNRLFVPVLALALAAGAALFARGWIEGGRQAPEAEAAPAPIVVTQVLIAAVNLAPGSFLRPEFVRWQDWPDVNLPASFLVRGKVDETTLANAVVRQAMAAGTPIAAGTIVQPGERGFLAVVLQPGMRAVSVPIDDTTGNSGLVLPGDRVDLILTQTLRAQSGADSDRRASETVLRDVRVIAMGRRLSPGGSGQVEEAERSQVRTATLEVTPEDAERVALATELGRLALSLRSLATDEATAELERAASARERRPTWDHELSAALGHAPAARPSMRVLRGGAKPEEE
jgi:pilus assembly protein CpaB